MFIPPPWSFSFLQAYDQCPKKAYHIYVAKDIPWKETDERRRGNETHTAFEKRLSAGKPLPKDLEGWEPFCNSLQKHNPEAELALGISTSGTILPFFDKTGQIYGRVKIDVAMIQGPAAFILDWKTGKKREDPFELKIQGMMLKARNPELTKITAQYAWVVAGELGKAHDVSDALGTWNDINGRVETIRKYGSQSHWPARQSPLCGWCEVLSCPYNPHREEA